MSKNSRRKRNTKKPDRRLTPAPPKQPTLITPSRPQDVQVTTEQRIEQFRGPIPPPDTLAKYEKVLEGSANRILIEFETQTAHRRAIESKLVEAETKDKLFARWIEFAGQVIAFIAMTGVIVAGLYLATMEGVTSKIVGGLLSGSSLIGIARAFIQGKRYEKVDQKKAESAD